ncbi:MAG: hypothetical protein LAT64_04265 [Phycisphaerales bacterium]|nr:hypothetical protein [Planctomycetota bacterium]MCH8507967.1 hypothetical protein [Phycisphaerales bacterium]
MRNTHTIGLGTIGVGLVLAAGSATATASTTTELTVIQDFDVATVFRSFFGGTDRSFLTNQARFQVNGDSLISTQSPLGIYTVFDIDGSTLRPGPGALSVDNIVFNLNAAVNQNTGSGGIGNPGELQIFYTTDNGDLNDKDFNTAGNTDASGLTGQFSDLFLLSSAFEDTGIRDINRTLDLTQVSGSLLDAINNGENIRFIIASPTPAATFQFATGLPDPSTIFDFFGEASTVEFSVTAVPAPGAAGVLALAGLAGLRRRR